MSPLKPEFIKVISEILPSHLSMEDVIHYSQQPLRPSIRVNTLKIDCEAFINRMTPLGWHFEAVPWCDNGFWLTRDDNRVQLGNTVEHQMGLFYIQEASSMMPPAALAYLCDSPEMVLDVASAPGSKTTQIAAWMGNQGLLMANEYSASRIKSLHANLSRLGISNVNLTHFDGRVFGATLPEQFDAILLDAPCSGEGTLRKDPESLSNWSWESVLEIANTQQDLIDSAFKALKPGGTLVYSTCTLNTEENQKVCHWLKDKYGDAVSWCSLESLFDGAHASVTDEGFLHVWPQVYDSEGFFVAAIQKNQSIDSEYRKPPLGKFPFKHASRKVTSELEDHLESAFGLSLPHGQLMSRDDELWLFPERSDELIGKIRMQRLGIKLAQQHKHGLKLTHELIVLCGADTDNRVDVNRDQAVSYLQGRDIPFDNPQKRKGEVVICFDDYPLGLAKWVGQKLKNSLPRELVRDKINVNA